MRGIDGSEILHQPQRIVDCGVGIAGGHGIADPEQLEAAIGVGGQRLGPSLDQASMMNFAQIRG
jgi:hypothetical protein